jgi:L-asparaginase
MPRQPRIAVISYGGTIASAVKPGVGAAPSVSMSEIAAQIPELGGFELVHQPSRLVASPHMTVDDLLDINDAVDTAIAQGCDGVVITQGTDTVEEIAFGLDLLYRGPAPVVITAAMRNASMAGADGPANLLASVRVAASPTARDLGVLVVVNDEIHAARFVRKSHTANTAAFRSAASGPLGWAAEADVRILVRPSRRFHVNPPKSREPIAVCLMKMALGDDGRLLSHLRAAGFAGLIIEGFGGGHVTPQVAEPERLAALVSAIPVVLTSRAGNGEILRSTYGGFAGSEMDLLGNGVIFAGALDGPKARILLILLRMNGASRGDIAKAFAEIGPLSG